MSGPTPSPTAARPSAVRRCRGGCTPTITTAATPHLLANHPPAASPTSRGNTTSPGPERPNVAFGAFNAPKAAFGAFNATKATLGRLGWGRGSLWRWPGEVDGPRRRQVPWPPQLQIGPSSRGGRALTNSVGHRRSKLPGISQVTATASREATLESRRTRASPKVKAVFKQRGETLRCHDRGGVPSAPLCARPEELPITSTQFDAR